MSDARLRDAERRYSNSSRTHDDLLELISAISRSGAEIPYHLRVEETTLYSAAGLNAQGLAEFRHKTTGMLFVLLPAGEFMMGPTRSIEDEDIEDDEEDENEDPPAPVRRVFDEPFLMAKYPWTGREWHRVTGEFPSHFPTRAMVEELHPEFSTSEDSRSVPSIPDTVRLDLADDHERLWGDHPVESVSWDRCREVEDWINRIDFARRFNALFRVGKGDKRSDYVRWLDVEFGIADLTPLGPITRRSDGEVDISEFGALIFSEPVEKAYQSWLWNSKGERCGFQLPSEAMWEYAARAGTTTRYPNGDNDSDLEKIAWFGGDWEEGHKAVGLKDPNNWGLHDNCGNVFEWTRCMWSENTSGAPVSGFVAHGEVCPDPTMTVFLNDLQIQELVSEDRPTPTCPGTQNESGNSSAQHQQIVDSDPPGERGDHPFVSAARSPVSIPSTAVASTHVKSGSGSSPESTEPTTVASESRSEASAGPVTQPVSSSEIRACSTSQMTELERGRPGGAALSTIFPAHLHPDSIIASLVEKWTPLLSRDDSFIRAATAAMLEQESRCLQGRAPANRSLIGEFTWFTMPSVRSYWPSAVASDLPYTPDAQQRGRAWGFESGPETGIRRAARGAWDNGGCRVSWRSRSLA